MSKLRPAEIRNRYEEEALEKKSKRTGIPVNELRKRRKNFKSKKGKK